MNTIESFLKSEESRFGTETNPNVKIGILFNLITLKNDKGITVSNYLDIKELVHLYFETIKCNSFGYDEMNHQKLNNLFLLLTPNERLSLIQYTLSMYSKELPEHNKDWLLAAKYMAEIDLIILNKSYARYPKIILLYSSTGFGRLFLLLTLLVILLTVILLPAPFVSWRLFSLDYYTYTDIFLWNHLLNVLSYLSGLDAHFEVTPLNPSGLILFMCLRLLIAVVIVNFIYTKILDRISVK